MEVKNTGLKVQYIPWIANGVDGWWSSINLKNISNVATVATVTEFDESGDALSTTNKNIPANGNNNWVIDGKTRSIMIEGSNVILVTAHQGKQDSMLTELTVHEVTDLKK